MPNKHPIFTDTPNVGPDGDNTAAGQTFVTADGTTAKTLYTSPSGGTGSLLRRMNIVSDDASNRDIDLSVWDGTTAFAIGTIPITAGDGATAATNATDGMDATAVPLFTDGALFLPAGYELRGAMQVAVTAADTITVVCAGADY